MTTKQTTARHVITGCASLFFVRRCDMLTGERGTVALSQARKAACFILHKRHRFTTGECARLFNYRDHTGPVKAIQNAFADDAFKQFILPLMP